MSFYSLGKYSTEIWRCAGLDVVYPKDMREYLKREWYRRTCNRVVVQSPFYILANHKHKVFLLCVTVNGLQRDISGKVGRYDHLADPSD